MKQSIITLPFIEVRLVTAINKESLTSFDELPDSSFTVISATTGRKCTLFAFVKAGAERLEDYDAIQTVPLLADAILKAIAAERLLDDSGRIVANEIHFSIPDRMEGGIANYGPSPAGGKSFAEMWLGLNEEQKHIESKKFWMCDQGQGGMIASGLLSRLSALIGKEGLSQGSVTDFGAHSHTSVGCTIHWNKSQLKATVGPAKKEDDHSNRFDSLRSRFIAHHRYGNLYQYQNKYRLDFTSDTGVALQAVFDFPAFETPTWFKKDVLVNEVIKAIDNGLFNLGGTFGLSKPGARLINEEPKEVIRKFVE